MSNTQEENESLNTSDFIPHFTYKNPNSKDLEQGDILSLKALKASIEGVHDYYSKHSSYTHFMVATQSCDLVRRPHDCKARSITLVPVRPVEEILIRELRKFQYSRLEKTANVLKKSFQPKIENFVKRLMNNNNPEYFYLHGQSEATIMEDSCAVLRVSISIRISEHYETCLSARKISLQEQFQAKLGWLVGNIYSRVGTEDWVPNNSTNKKFAEIVQAKLVNLCSWIDDEKLEKANKELTKYEKTELVALGSDRVLDYLNNIELLDKRQIAIERATQKLKKNYPEADEQQFQKDLEQDIRFNQLFLK